jgi:hypothetical protein
MKVLDLHCQHAHSFEGWFGSEDDFQSQLARGLVLCPMCGDATITKKLSAPRLNLLGTRAITAAQTANEQASQFAKSTGATEMLADSAAAQAAAVSAPDTMPDTNRALSSGQTPFMQAMAQDPQFQAAYLQMARTIMANTEDVGSQFAQEARKMHYGEANERPIRGQATRDETLELLDEGIEVLPLVLPEAFKNTLQ